MAQIIPKYELYGDLLAGRAPEPIHLEPIFERSAKHNWTIRVHSHRRLAQVFLFRSPGVSLTVGDMAFVTTEPILLVVPPDVSHGFHFPEDIDGDVLSIRLNEVPPGLNDRFQALTSGAIFRQPVTPRFAEIVGIFEQLSKAFYGLESQRIDVMTVLVELMMLYVGETHSQALATRSIEVADRLDRRGSQAITFCALLEENFQKQWAVEDYASQMGISASHLTRICRGVLNSPPNSLVRQRRILEAKRLLEYTSLPLYEIALRSGFRETAFFSRTFKALVGMTPRAYRLDAI